jgi:VWFA-related protein
MRSILVSIVVILSLTAFAQEQLSSDIPGTTIRIMTRLVIVDTVVTDKAGKPVADLKPEDFTILEDGKPQKLMVFAPWKRVEPSTAQPPPLPPGVYTNRPEYRTPPGPMTVLLVDAMNTPTADQAYTRTELVKYLKTQLHPGERIAVFALAGRLHLLQDFTSDPELLRQAVEDFKPQDSHNLRAEDVEGNLPPPPRAGELRGGYQASLGGLHALLVERAIISLNERVAQTLLAFRMIARAVAGYPGRKNLIWVSGSFPLAFTAQGPFDPQRISAFRSYQREILHTSDLLGDAEVSIYPVDARGLVGATAVDASTNMTNRFGDIGDGEALGQAISNINSALLASHAAMEEVAASTGGQAYFNRNDIDHAVALSVADGGASYTLGYYPSNKNLDGNFRTIQVKVSRPGVRMRHRRGYHAVDLVQQFHGESDKDENSELMLALHRDPMPATMVIFDARVVPPPLSARMTLPVEFLVDSNSLSYDPLPDGGRKFDVDFHAAALAPDGRVVAHADTRLLAPADRTKYEQIRREGLPLRTQLKLPTGRYQLRLLVRDNRTGFMGSAEIPIALELAGK